MEIERISKLGREYFMILGFAHASAARRSGAQITIEDLFVGMRWAIGRKVLRYFDPPNLFEEFVRKTCPGEITISDLFPQREAARNFSPLELPDEVDSTTAYGIAAAFIEKSRESEELLSRVEDFALNSGMPVNVEIVSKAIANCEPAMEILRANGILLRRRSH